MTGVTAKPYPIFTLPGVWFGVDLNKLLPNSVQFGICKLQPNCTPGMGWLGFHTPNRTA